MSDLGREELEEAVQLVCVPSQGGSELCRVGFRDGLERSYVDLKPVPELLDASEHAHRVPFREARVEELDVVPDACVDPPAWIDQLEREIRRSAASCQLAL